MSNVLDIQRGMAEIDRQKEAAEAKERFLKLFRPGNAPFSIEAQAQRVEMGVYQGIKGFFEAGCGLVLIKEYDAQTYAQLLESRFKLPLRTAQFWERFARICVFSPRFQQFFNQSGMVHKGMNLMAGLSDPEIEAELATFEETGELLGLDEVVLHTKTNKELKAENRKLRALRDKKYESLEKENDQLTAQIEGLQAQRLEPGLEKAQKLFKAGKTKLTEAWHTLAQADYALLTKDAGSIAIIRLAIDEGRRILDEMEKKAFMRGQS